MKPFGNVFFDGMGLCFVLMKVYDSRVIEDRFLGRATVPVVDLANLVVFKEWLTLEERGEEDIVNGEIEVELELVPATDVFF